MARRHSTAALAVLAAAVLVACGGGNDPETAATDGADAARVQALALPQGTAVNADAYVKGQFGPVQNWPVIPIHVALTADGRVLGYGSDNTGRQTGSFNYGVWDPVSNAYTTLSNGSGTDIFCSSQMLLPLTNQVFIAGGDNWTGTSTTNTGNNNSNIFNAATNTLTRGVNMNRARWYSSSTMLLNGEILIQGGSGGSDRPEIRQADGSFRLLSGADTSALSYDFPRNFPLPDGRLFGFDTAGHMYYLNTAGTGSVTMAGQFPNATAGGDSSGAMFRPGRILQYGGNSRSAIVIDVTGATPSVTNTGALKYQRRLSTATVMADGRVLATGGSSVWNSIDPLAGAVVAYEAEIWDPATGTWLVGATHRQARLYHSVALLLPDATVMVAGGGAPGPQNNLNQEIYYPPYLFKSDRTEALRPVITAAPTVVDAGRTVQISVSHDKPIARVTFVKSGSVTHGWNMDQRFVDLPFTAQGGQLNVQIPGRASDVPPGMWMMFVLDSAGVPSMAKLMRVNVAAALNTSVVPTLANPGARSGLVGTATSLQLSASDPNGDALTYSAAGLPPGLSVNASNGLISGTPTAAGDYSVTVSVSDGYNSASANFTWSIANPTPLSLASLAPLTPTVSGASATFSATATGTNPRYSWNFGDGTAPTAWSSSGSASHVFAAPGIYYVTVSVTDDTAAVQSSTVMHQVFFTTTAQAPSIGTSIAYETRAGANARVWAINADNDSVSVFDAVTRARLAEIATGIGPRALAIAPDGSIWVTNKQAATVSVISPATLAVTRTIALARGSQPYGVAFARASGTALVALEGTGQLLRIGATDFATQATLNVGANARHVSVAADGRTAYVTRFITPPLAGESTTTVNTASGGGQVVVVDSSTMTVTRTILLAHSNVPDAEAQGRGLPNYLGAAAISPDGTQAWVPSKMDNVARGLLRDGLSLNFQNTVRAISSRVVLGSQTEDLAARIDHDNASVASAAAFDPLGVYLFVALETSREVAVLDAHRRVQMMRIDVGRAPQGLVVSPDRSTLYVHNFMDRSVDVIDLRPLLQQGLASAPRLATLPSVGTEKLSATVLRGKQFFYDARDTRLARDRYMSCASCHNDGDGDGRVWDLAAQGEGLRNTIALRGRAGAQGLLHWSANFDEVQDFEGQIRALAGGSGLMSDTDFATGTRSQPLGDRKAGVSADLDALAAYVASLNTFAPSPHRASAGALTATGAAGRDVFAAKGCAACHGGAGFTNSNPMGLQNIGTIKPSSGQRLNGPLTGLDIPTLRDVWNTAPYLHDGSAATLDAAVLAHNGVSLTAGELSSLVQYLREIGVDEPEPPLAGPPGLVVAYGLNEGTGGGATDQSGVGHTGTLVNGPAWTAAGRYGWALGFDGVDDALSVGTPSTLSFAGDFTVMMWVKRNALGGTVQRHLFSKCDAASWVSGCKELYFAGDTLRFGSWSTGDVSSVAIADTNWHHVGVVFTRATNAVQIYVDGALVTSSTRNLEADGAAHVVTIGNLMGKNTFSGLIDEVRIYSRPLTAAQLQTDMNTPLTPVADVTPPVLSAGGPSGTLPAGTTQATLAVTSSESATCRYSTTAGVAYASMASTFAATGGTSHTTPVSGLANGQSYSFYVRCQDTSGNATTSDLVIAFSVGTADTTAPSVNITAPAAGATVSGTVNITASANDNVGVAGVQFLLDGVNLGSEVTAAPYTLSWATAGTTNGTHVLGARVRDAAGNQATAATVSVVVSNTDGLVAAFGLDEGGGTATADRSGFGHTGTLVNGPAWTAAGRYGWALGFDGVDDALSVGTPSTLNFAGDFTVMMWVKRNALGGTAQRHLFSKCDAASWVSGCKELYFAGDTLRFGSWSTGDVSSVAIADTNWHHVGVVFTRATNAVQIYVDGALVTSSTRNLEADGAAHVVTIGNLMGKNTFSGLIDEVRIYSRPLTAAQLQTAMNTALSP